MNILQMREVIDRYLDRTKSARYNLTDYSISLNSSIDRLINDRVDNIKAQKNYSYERMQRVVDELRTMAIEIPLTPTGNTIAYPADYRFGILLSVTIDGVTNYSKFIDEDERGQIARDPFRSPKNVANRIRHYVVNGVATVLFGPTGTLTAATLTYIKNPTKVSIGYATDLINDPTTLAAINYYAVEETTFSGTLYHPGDTIVGSVTPLTSGTVIPVSAVVNCDLPVSLHEEICILAAQQMILNIEDTTKGGVLENIVERG